MKKIIILILTLFFVNTLIQARGYPSGDINRGYRISRNYGRYNNKRWGRNPYGWGNRNGWRSNYWNSYYQPYSIFNTWPYDEYYDTYDGYYSVNDYDVPGVALAKTGDCDYYPNHCSFNFSIGY